MRTVKVRILLFICCMLAISFVLNSISSAQQKKPAPPPLAVAEGEDSGVRVEIQELKRTSDNMLMLKFVMINDSDKKMDFGFKYGSGDPGASDFNSIGGVYLTDGVNKKKYLVVRDATKKCLCSANLKGVEPKGRINLWAKFPAPPDNVQKISVTIPHVMPIDDVPISR